MQALEVEYDSSFFDTDPYEPMPGGTMSIWPFFLGHFVELPYTLVQDHTLSVILGERTPRLWLDKVDFIEHLGYGCAKFRSGDRTSQEALPVRRAPGQSLLLSCGSAMPTTILRGPA